MAAQVQESRTPARFAYVALGVGAVVAVVLGVFGKAAHDEGHAAVLTTGFGGLATMKVYLSTVVAVLALVQIVTALWLYGRLGSRIPRHLGVVHKTSGALAVLLSIPVAFNCLWLLGFESYNFRVAMHSIAGCVFYGAFVAKVMGLHARRAPGWLVTVAAGLVFAAIVVVVWTGAVWYVGEFGWPSTSTGE
ncbi:MAG TPA: DUF6529 family protein [Nocardioidaceae bacterium]|jgi:hypothetical protein